MSFSCQFLLSFTDSYFLTHSSTLRLVPPLCLMAQSSHFRDLETDLDALGFHPLTHVPFQLHPALKAAQNDALERRVAIALQDPTLDRLEADLARGLFNYDSSFERQVLDTLKQRQDQAQKQLEQEAEQWEQYQAQQTRLKAEKEVAMAAEEAVQKAEAEKSEPSLANGHDDECPSSEETNESISTPLNRLNLAPGPVRAAPPPPVPLRQPAEPINFSEFEAESDPFESLALQSINDFQELAAVLQTSQRGPICPPNPFVTSHTSTTVNQPAFPPYNSPGPFPARSFPAPPTFFNYFPPAQTSPAYFPRPPEYSQIARQSPNVAPTVKNSQSFGDIISEIKKEAQAEVRKKNSQTPPPRPANLPGSATKLTDWIPWPDLDGPSTFLPAKDDPLALISAPDQRRLCQQIHDMGFPLARVARVCQALKDKTGQNIINFCLLVDKFIGESGLPEEEVEYVLHLKSSEESHVRAHLKAFRTLKELGFSSKDIHHALVECDSDHDKALEKLLKT